MTILLNDFYYIPCDFNLYYYYARQPRIIRAAKRDLQLLKTRWRI